jgi:hypothetical protein
VPETFTKEWVGSSGRSFCGCKCLASPWVNMGDAVLSLVPSPSNKAFDELNPRIMQVKMAGAGGKTMGSYDYLIKLMLIGDSGKKKSATFFHTK